MRLSLNVISIAREAQGVKGYRTRVFPPSGSQRVGGLIVNRRLNIPRREHDDMRAILHNCVRFGAESQNRERHPHYREHLLGRIAYVESVHPDRGRKLRTLFKAIPWPPED
ncbi:MAG: hypothetical protein KDA75_21365 [Planctomycetaceae bacterium]|nr:hypothetical protein [Planctomycetaceae bacterium]